ncbi:hypothetical protein FACS189472_17220 [Alphaproteobacteria bacterium]|nr:hypothetical protein FACS189472_17220 [Alphaproteobacteria bacterium]
MTTADFDLDLNQLFKITADNQFVPLKFDANYEISVNYPHVIRRISDKFYPEVSLNKHTGGYQQLGLGRRIGNVLMHRLIALQWVHNFNPGTDTQVDHINGNIHDNSVSNLCWCSRSRNQRNRHTNYGDVVEYTDEIPAGSRPVKNYGVHRLEPGYWLWRDSNNVGPGTIHMYYQTHYYGNTFKYYELVPRLIKEKYPCFKVRANDGRSIQAMLARLGP